MKQLFKRYLKCIFLGFLFSSLLIIRATAAEPHNFVEWQFIDSHSHLLDKNIQAQAVNASFYLAPGTDLIIGYQQDGDIEYQNFIQAALKQINYQTNFNTVEGQTTFNFEGVALAFPENATYITKDTLLRLRAYRDLTSNAQAYWDIGYDRKSIYGLTANGPSTRLGMRFKPLNNDNFQANMFFDYKRIPFGTVINYQNIVNFDLTVEEKIIGAEFLWLFKNIGLGFTLERLDRNNSLDEFLLDQYLLSSSHVSDKNDRVSLQARYYF